MSDKDIKKLKGAESASESEMAEAYKFLKTIKPIAGQTIRIEKCLECGQLIGRHFIPYSLGRGMTYNPCACVMVDNNARTEGLIELDN